MSAKKKIRGVKKTGGRRLLLINSPAEIAEARERYRRAAAGVKAALRRGTEAEIKQAYAAFQRAFAVYRRM